MALWSMWRTSAAHASRLGFWQHVTDVSETRLEGVQRATAACRGFLREQRVETAIGKWNLRREQHWDYHLLSLAKLRRQRFALGPDASPSSRQAWRSLSQSSVDCDTRKRALRSLSSYVGAAGAKSLEAAYLKLIGSRGYQWDTAQINALRVLQIVCDGVAEWTPEHPSREATPPNPPKGAYLWSTLPGTGKTMLMELFYEYISVQRKRRAHFSAFMAEIHRRLHELRNAPRMQAREPRRPGMAQRLFGALFGNGPVAEEQLLGPIQNPIDVVASEIAHSSWLLCLDEMQVTDIADAMVLRRFYEAFRAHGGVLVTTSNRAPTNLYENGLQRDLFLPFIEALQQDCYIHKVDGRVDYRMQTLLEENAGASSLPLYIFPLTAANRQRFERLLQVLAKDHVDTLDQGTAKASLYETVVIRVLARNLVVGRAVPRAFIVRFRFEELCDRPLAAADYIALAERFQTFFLEDIPSCIKDRNIARRFITLVDILYDRRARLICLAESAPENLFQIADEKSDEAFAAQRCVSRIMDMQTKAYMEGPLRNDGARNRPKASSNLSVGTASSLTS
ncbi:hypothetical protein CCYA_CCYA02G0588 [Cyanidiococcus yangmingshanensis]|nr:hypothetical protein CCYA_CCYA02G0588 [Cyanidiococcus yangmingshanensis]